MRKSVKLTLSAAVASLVLLTGSAVSLASPKIAKDTGVKPCTTCHTAMGKKDLNPAGTCYKEKKDLKACNIAAPPAAK
jgi:hypothetical protein